MSGLNPEKEETCRTLTPVRRPVRSGIWRCACGGYSGGVEYRLERYGDLYCRNYYQPAA